MKNIDSVVFPIRKGRKEKPKSKFVEVTINEPLNAALVEHMSATQLARDYLRLKGEIDEREKMIKQLRGPLESVLRCGTLVVGDIKLNLQDCQRENFRLKDAKEFLKAELLAPFISVSKYTKIVPSVKK